MLGHNWYFQTIKRYTAIFGLLFDNININRTDDDGNEVQAMKVPLAYGPKDAILSRLSQDPDISRQPAITLPRMSFELGSIFYNGDRKLPKVNRWVKQDASADFVLTQFTPVAYDFTYKLHIYVKNTEDGTKIVEQILPFFTPDYTVPVQLIPEMGLSQVDIPITLRNVSMDDKYDGAFTERRVMLWELDFNLQGYIYGPVITKPLIKFVVTNFYVDANNDPVARLTVQPGLTANGEATANVSISIDPHDIFATDDWGVVKIANTGPFSNN